MKRIKKEKIECCRAKDLKKYSKTINQYFKKRWRFIFFFALASCSVQSPIDKEEYTKLSKDFTVRFFDKVDTIHPVSMYDNQIYTRSFLKNFTDNAHVNYSKPIELTIKNKELFIKFEGALQQQYVLKFYGKQHKNRFVFYTNYETITFPVLFTSKQMTKFTVYFPDKNEINFKEFHVGEGMFLFFGASNSYDNIYKFKILTDE